VEEVGPDYAAGCPGTRQMAAINSVEFGVNGSENGKGKKQNGREKL
jgi:hypothetical protein